jgi:hypothetical protein
VQTEGESTEAAGFLLHNHTPNEKTRTPNVKDQWQRA